MSSKFNMKSRATPPVSYTWSSPPRDLEAEKKSKEYDNHLKLEKERVEAIPLGQLSFKDLYQFPFRQSEHSSWVYDNIDNFIFQFEFRAELTRKKIIEILNGEMLEYKRQDVEFKGGQIFINGDLAITIRGWGSLTGIGGYNLDGEYAGKIQDTLGEYIVEKLNK